MLRFECSALHVHLALNPRSHTGDLGVEVRCELVWGTVLELTISTDAISVCQWTVPTPSLLFTPVPKFGIGWVLDFLKTLTL